MKMNIEKLYQLQKTWKNEHFDMSYITTLLVSFLFVFSGIRLLGLLCPSGNTPASSLPGIQPTITYVSWEVHNIGDCVCLCVICINHTLLHSQASCLHHTTVLFVSGDTDLSWAEPMALFCHMYINNIYFFMNTVCAWSFKL